MAIVTVVLIAAVFVGPIVLATVGVIRARLSQDAHVSGETPSAPSPAWPRIINFAVLYALAFNVVFFFQELFLVLPKAFMPGLRPTLFHNDHSWEGTNRAVELAQGSGALAIFIIGLIFVLVFFRLRKSTGLFKLFALWMAYHGLVQSFPQITFGVLDRGTDVGQALEYLNVSETLGILISIVALAALVVIGLLLTRPLLEMSPSVSVVGRPRSRTTFIFQIGTLASVLGAMLIIPLRLPLQDPAPIVLIFFALPWTLANAWRTKKVQVIGTVSNETISWVPIGLLVVLLAIFQLVLARGIAFF